MTNGLIKKSGKRTFIKLTLNSRKYLWMTLNEQVIDSYDRHFKALKEEIAEDIRR